MHNSLITALLLAVSFSIPSSGVAQQIAPTDLLPAREQQRKFQLPDGFEIQLVVDETHIGQPMNLNFDARGRLWVTHSVEYPYPANTPGVQPRGHFAGVGDHPPRDRITILSDIQSDGTPQSIEDFQTSLNIPIGHLPLSEGSTALVYDIPAIRLMEDTDGDQQADKTEVLYEGFGNVDTHGMTNSFTRGFDGWIYACHGFSNQSTIADRSGHQLKLTSGNTYRFRVDGSQVEQFTFGQVNPFGLTFDPWGNLYSADCHTRPLTLLLRGARYPHFGNPPDGLGFGPEMIDHNHGSTGICGPTYYAAAQFPADYRDNIFLCNPVTGRVHRDKLLRTGSTYRCDTQPDFITCDDPWFRPVDAQVGPDGALYIADFYNAIIGHYEVPLEHPKRDRTHGRIWRVVWKGEATRPVPGPADLTALTFAQRFELLADPNLTVRLQALNLLLDTAPEQAVQEVQKFLSDEQRSTEDVNKTVASVWILQRTKNLSQALTTQLSRHPNPVVRTHLMKAFAETEEWPADSRKIVVQSFDDENGFVCRAAVEASGVHPDASQMVPLLSLQQQCDPQDTHLVYAIRRALREHLREQAVVKQLIKNPLPSEFREVLVTSAAEAESSHAAQLLLTYGDAAQMTSAQQQLIAEQVASTGTEQQIQQLLQMKQDWEFASYEQELQLLILITEGLKKQKFSPNQFPALENWLSRLIPSTLATIQGRTSYWEKQTLNGQADTQSPWGIRSRQSADGSEKMIFWDSIVGGESRTGKLVSQPFPLPPRLSFWLCGHNGQPPSPDARQNLVQLIKVSDGTILHKAFPPRNDTAQQIVWESSEEQVREEVVLELIDAHTGTAYAWLGAGRFSLPELTIVADSTYKYESQLLKLIPQVGLQQFASYLIDITRNRQQPEILRVAALETLAKSKDMDALLPLAIETFSETGNSLILRQTSAQILVRQGDDEMREAVLKQLEVSPTSIQQKLASILLQHDNGLALILNSIEQGKFPARLLLDVRIKEQYTRTANSDQLSRIAKLTRDLPDEQQQAVQLLQKLLATHATSIHSTEQGKQVFLKNCAACHKIGEVGHVIGPQLEGIGQRGLARLLEDTLLPNRNVDVAFRTVTILKTDGTLVSGLKLREEPASIVIADTAGKQQTIPQEEIELTRDSPLSLMPANFYSTIPETDWHDLLAYLLSQQTKTESAN